MHQCCTRQTQWIRAGIMCNYPLAKELENTNITFKAGQFQWIILYNVVNFKTCPLVVHSDNFHTERKIRPFLKTKQTSSSVCSWLSQVMLLLQVVNFTVSPLTPRHRGRAWKTETGKRRVKKIIKNELRRRRTTQSQIHQTAKSLRKMNETISPAVETWDSLGVYTQSFAIPNPEQKGQVRVSAGRCQSNSHIHKHPKAMSKKTHITDNQTVGLQRSMRSTGIGKKLKFCIYDGTTLSTYCVPVM